MGEFQTKKPANSTLPRKKLKKAADKTSGRKPLCVKNVDDQLKKQKVK